MANAPGIGDFAASFVDDRQYRLLVESITDYAIYMLDLDGTIASWNAGAERFKGYSSTEAVGRNFAIFYTMEDQASGEPQRALEAAMREGRFESEGWRIRKDNSRFWASVVVEPIREGDVIIGFAKVTRDISERMEAEKALILANQALLQSQKMEAVGQLTGGIAHDFNNLLAAVLGSLELLRKRLPGDPKVLRLLDNAIKAAHRGTALTQRMLVFARRQDFAPDEINLPSLVRGMIGLLQPALGPSVTIETRLPAKLDRIMADTNQVEMALLNLAVNARDAMHDGGTIIIAVREAWLDEGQVHGLTAGSYACLSVTDPGVGMDEATLSRAMEPFFTTKGPGQGTGLGLSMVHGMAIQAGGRLVLKSEIEKGTVAEIWLPFSTAKPATARTPPASSRPARELLPSVILAVDDDPLVLLNTVMMLEDLGHTVFEASSGKRALEVLGRESSIKIVITEIAMRHMSGLQLVEAVKGLRQDLRFVLATGYAEASAGEQPKLVMLTKPFFQDDLARAIQAALDPAPTNLRILKFPSQPD